MQPLVFNAPCIPNAGSNSNKNISQLSLTFSFLSDIKWQVNIHTYCIFLNTHAQNNKEKETTQRRFEKLWLFLNVYL